MIENDVSLAAYVELLEGDNSDMANLLSEDTSDIRRDSENHNSVFKTWKISFDKIRKQYPRAAEIMSIMAVVDRQSIPEILLRRYEERETDIKIDIAPLKAFSLIQSETSQTSFEVHRLVHFAVQQWLKHKGTRLAYQEKALSTIARAFDWDERKACEALYPHAQTLVSQSFRGLGAEAQTNFVMLLESMIVYLQDCRGNYRLAHLHATTALEVRESIGGPRSPEAISTRRLLGGGLCNLGDYADALEVLQRVVMESEEVFGPGDKKTFLAKYFMAWSLNKLGRFQEPKTLYLEASSGFEALEGHDSVSSLSCQEGLVVVLVSY